MKPLGRRLRRIRRGDALLLLALATTVAAATALFVWPELLSDALGRRRVG